jgi:hypothetical protein
MRLMLASLLTAANVIDWVEVRLTRAATRDEKQGLVCKDGCLGAGTAPHRRCVGEPGDNMTTTHISLAAGGRRRLPAGGSTPKLPLVVDRIRAARRGPCTTAGSK